MVLLLVSLAFFAIYYYLYQNKQSNKIEGDFYNQFTGQWEKTALDSKGINPSKVIKSNNTDGLNNHSLMKGYFNFYDETSQTLNIRAAIAFTQSSLFEPVDLKLSPSQSVYCVPETYTDLNTGKSYSLKNLRIPVKDGATLFVPGEKIISFTDFVEKSNQLNFLLVQLTEDFDQARTNYVKKIIVTDLCD